MKTKSALFGLCAVLLGCREEYIDLCRGESSIVVSVILTSDSLDEDEGLVVTREDETNMDHYSLKVYPYNDEGMILPRGVDWRITNPALVRLFPVPPDEEHGREGRALVQTLEDILDRGGETEPETTVVACVANDCANYQGGSECVQCQSEVCSRPITVRSVINAEGSWELSGATFPPIPIQLHVLQTGHELTAVSSEYEPRIEGRWVTFRAGGDWQYVGEFTDREHVAGEVTRLSTGENLGEWTATKCPPTGCPDPTP